MIGYVISFILGGCLGLSLFAFLWVGKNYDIYMENERGKDE